MTINLSENKKKALITFINQHFDEHMSRFPYAKYPAEPLDIWRKQFANPSSVRPDILRSALSWQCGYWQRKDAPHVYKKIAIIAIKAWPEFTDQALTDPSEIFGYWIDKFSSDTHGFDATSYLLHLLLPEIFELADHYRLAAMRDLLKETGHDTTAQETSPDLSDLMLYTEFFRALLPKMQTNHQDRARVQLDRFLKAYGNREVLAKVAGKTGPTIEPQVPYVDWEKLTCQHFQPESIVARSNADILFACLLIALDKTPEQASTLTIAEVVTLLPLGSGGICNPGSYHYAMIAMFGGQKGRDFFIFEEEALSTAFTEQANNSTRDMRFYHKHEHAKISINPRYTRT
ncbi:hypothetical protein MKY63_10785 [Paenibacillus sp. FSL R7-0189]|uniref:hypothetical protein n=1 Tax=Paenibacillus sp. FSL R7-0189 TaxID=2921673 RepID=UPI0030D9B0B4